MCNILRTYHWMIRFLKQLIHYQRVNFSFLLIWSFFFMGFSACTTLNNSQLTMTTVPESGLDVTITLSLSPETLLPTNTPSSTDLTDVQLTLSSDESVFPPSLAPSPTFISEGMTATVTPSPQAEIQRLAGQLFIYDSVGIQQISVRDGSADYLLTAENDWLDWATSFAQNKKYAVYWIKRGNETELWFTSLPQWQPQLVLKIDDIEYDFATPLWAVNDRYLLFKLSVMDNSGQLEEVKTIRTYILDTVTMELVSQPYWPGDCFLLAPSPQTDQLALWCSKIQEPNNTEEFLVLELNETPWLTPQSPELLTDSCYFAKCA